MTSRVAIIGAGHVGATAAFALLLRGLFAEMVLIDADRALATAQAADLADAAALTRPARVWAGDYADAAGASVAILTAGAATKSDEPRLAVAARSAVIVAACARDLQAAGFAGIVVVAANPVDLMAHVAFTATGFAASRVIGTGTLLDSCRLQARLGAALGVAPADVAALVVGEHGDSEVVAFSTARVGGMTLDAAARTPLDRDAIAAAVRDEGYRIIGGKGSTEYGIATAIVRIVEAVVRDEHAVIPVSTLLTGEFGIDGVYLSLPCVLGAGGVERVLQPDLDPGERAALARSAATLGAAMAAL